MEEMTGVEAAAARVHVMHVVRHGFAGGGMENGIINVANRLPPESFRISLCALDRQETFSQRIRHAEFHLLPKHGPGIDWSLIWRLAQLFRRAQVDVVHSHNWGTFLYAVVAAKLAHVPVIHGEHGKNAGELEEANWPKYWAKRLLGRRVDRLITVSQQIAREWEAYGIPSGKIQWVPNGVDTERFRPRIDQREQRRNFGLRQEGLLLGSIGRLDALKNYEVLIAAFARMAPEFPDSHLALLGEGPCTRRLQKTAEELGIADRVHLLGRRSNPEDFLATVDIFVLPSKTEGMSNVVLEAMASAIPIVCSALPCHREVFEPDREGIAVSPCTAEALAETLAALCRDPERRKALGLSERNKITARFNIARMVADYARVYAKYARTKIPQMAAAVQSS
ncbi:MAG TPA: glycosyltransferase [Bryobacteraceae bacterium]|nr:glycosyltransferase [Bryobacteraceae bacterium]